MIPFSALGGSRPPGAGVMSGGSGGASMDSGRMFSQTASSGGANMIPLGAFGASGMSLSTVPSSSSTSTAPSMVPPSGPPPSVAPSSGQAPSMSPPSGAPPIENSKDSLALASTAPGSTSAAAKPNSAQSSTLAEVGKAAKDYLDVLMPIAIPKSEDEAARPVPKQIVCLENGTDLFKMFDVDTQRFDPKAVRRGYHKMAQYVHPDKIGRDTSPTDQARFLRLKQAYTVMMDEQLRAVYRQHCFGINGTGGCAAQGHEVALSKALELGRELRKMGEERAIVLHKASEVGWSTQQKDQDGRTLRGDGRKLPHQFHIFEDISSSEDGDAELEKERRGLTISQILERSPKYADKFLEAVRPILMDAKVSKPAAGGAFTMLEEPKLLDMLNDNPKSVQKHLRKVRAAVKQMNWAMTALLQHKESPWRSLEVKASLVEHGTTKLLELIKSGIAFGKFSEVHEDDFAKILDNLHRLYMDLFERRGQELLRSAIQSEIQVVYLLPESEGRLPDDTRVTLQDLSSRADLNGKGGIVTGWDYSLQRYTVELEKEEKNTAAPSNPDLLTLGDVDEDEDEEEEKVELAIPKKLMVMPKNALVDFEPARRRLESLVKDWNAWRRRPRSVSASQDAEAVAAALGPPLESMASFLQEAASAVGTASACGRDGADLIAFECREALQNARNLAAKLLGEEPSEPPPPPPLNEPPPALVPLDPVDEVKQALKEAAEVAQAGIEIQRGAKKRSRSRGRRRRSASRSRRRRRRRSSSSERSESFRPHRKPKFA